MQEGNTKQKNASRRPDSKRSEFLYKKNTRAIVFNKIQSLKGGKKRTIIIYLVGAVGLEPTAFRLRVYYSTN